MSGYSINGAGDVDGDGDIELLFGGQKGNDYGVVYLMRGPIAPGETELATEAQGFFQYDTYLWQGVGPGDLDGDGLDDIVIGETQAADGGGRVWVLRGPVPQNTLDDAEMIIAGEGNQGIGAFLATPGDLDGDGLADFATTRAASTNAAFLVTDFVPGVVAPEDVGATVDYGTGVPGRSVFPLAPGDVNADGHPDMGFWGGVSTTLIIVFGPFDATADVNLSEDWDVKLVSDNAGLTSSNVQAATTLGDWDGDGFDDLAITNTEFVQEEFHDTCDNGWCDVYRGAVFLLAGPLEPGTIDLEQVADRVDNPNYDETSNVSFGPALAGGEDLDGDGFPDLAIGNHQVDTAYVLFGGGAW